MEFMDIDLLKEGVNNSEIFSFEELKKLPIIEISMDCKLIESEDNLKKLQITIDSGSAVAKVRKININNNTRKDFPKRVLFEMTSKCNVLCRMCPRNHLLRPAIHQDTEVYKRVLDELNTYKIDGLWLYHLGESLMHPHFREIVSYLSNLDSLGFIWMSSNGHLMNQANIDFILSSKIDFINFSLHAVTKEVYNTVVPSGDFDRVLSNYHKLIKSKNGRLKTPFIHLQMIEQETTKHEVDTFIRNHYKEVEIVSVNMLEYVNLPNNEFGESQRKRIERGHCNRIKSEDCFILSNGSVTVCDVAYNCSETIDQELFLGDINKDTLYNIWNSDKRKLIMQKELDGKLTDFSLCANCTDYDF